MTKVAILSMPGENGGVSYYAMAGDKRSFGHTAGEALDSLTSQLPHEDTPRGLSLGLTRGGNPCTCTRRVSETVLYSTLR